MKVISLVLCAAFLPPTGPAGSGPPPESTRPVKFRSYTPPPQAPDVTDFPPQSHESPVFKSADDFGRVFIRRLQKVAELKDAGVSGGGDDSVYTLNVSRTVPAAALSPDGLSDLAKEAVLEWDGLKRYRYSTSDGRGPHYLISFGDKSACVFVNVVAYAEGAVTRIDLHIRGVRLES